MSNSRSPRFDQAFLERKRRQLTALREQLQKAADSGEAEEAAVKNESAGGAREYEDDAQKLDTLETRGNLVNHDIDRLARVERALNKIDAGTYGFSDVSGERIPDHRLEAMPEAINTLQEQEASERAG
jgi:DnaK suppressor protein